ncbi:MAG: hypothetical protein ABH872_04960 [Candidatus Omnitrophota bacterium]
MNKKRISSISYAQLDSVRLRETFFSPPQQPKNNQRKLPIFFIALFIFLFIISGLLLIKINYDLVLIDKKPLELRQTSQSLLYSETAAAVSFLGENQSLSKINKSSLQLLVSPGKKSGIKLTFDKPIDLDANSVTVFVYNLQVPIKLETVAKDTRYFSNSLFPVLAEISPASHFDTNSPAEEKVIKSGSNNGSSLLSKASINLKNLNLQNVNPYRVKQMTFYFSPLDESRSNWIIIKDIVLSKNNQNQLANNLAGEKSEK